jgi:hypothetical protein
MKTQIRLGVILAVCVLTFSAARAQQLGFNFSSPGTNDNGASLAVTGFRFQVTSSTTINALAAFNPSAPGGIGGSLSFNGDPIRVGLWDDSGTLLRSVSVPVGTTPISGTYFSSASITPITLEPGFYRIADDGFRTYVSGSSPSGFSGYTSLSGLTYVETVYNSSGSGFSFPNITAQATDPSMLNVSFVSAIPEPSTYALIGGALALAVALARRARSRRVC